MGFGIRRAAVVAGLSGDVVDVRALPSVWSGDVADRVVVSC